MNSIIESLTGMNVMTDQVIASDFLISAKSAIILYSAALTEASTLEVKLALRDQLEAAINTHEKITDYMMRKGLYHPYNIHEQIELDMRNTQTTLNLPNM
jgi:similar to spore coat protein